MNWHALYCILDAARANRHLMWKDVAAQTGINPSTFTRLKQHRGVDLDTYAKCCQWLGVSLDKFVPPPYAAPQETPDLTADLITLFARHRVPEVHWTALVHLITNLTNRE